MQLWQLLRHNMYFFRVRIIQDIIIKYLNLNCLLKMMEQYLQTHDDQFGFKS